MEKTILLDKRAEKELKSFPRIIQLKFQALFEILEQTGKLEEPFGKKLSSRGNLFEMRVKHEGQWRAIYAYMQINAILILSAFGKKTQKTPIVEMEKAKKRLAEYKESI